MAFDVVLVRRLGEALAITDEDPVADVFADTRTRNALRACIDGAALNVRINLAGLKDEKAKSSLQGKVQKITAEFESEFTKINQIVESKIG